MSYEKCIKKTQENLDNLPSIKDRIYSLMTYHKDIIELSGMAHCLECSSDIKSGDIQEWTDLNTTGICPICGVDKLIPSITKETLDQSYEL
jgi:rubredoxin